MQWDSEKMVKFYEDIAPFFELFHNTEEGDWVRREVGEENEHNVKLIRMAYLLSRFSEMYAGKLVNINVEHKGLWKRIEEEVSNEP